MNPIPSETFQTWGFSPTRRNYLVISGHDAMQSEQLFLKHVGPNDAFVQADVAGARTCFVRNPSGDVIGGAAWG